MNTFGIEHHGGHYGGGKRTDALEPIDVKLLATATFGAMPSSTFFGPARSAIGKNHLFATNHIAGTYLGIYQLSTQTMIRPFGTIPHRIISSIAADNNDEYFYFIGRYNNTGVLALMCFNTSLGLVWKRDEITGDNYFGNHLYNEGRIEMDANFIYVVNWYRARVTKFNRQTGDYVGHGFYPSVGSNMMSGIALSPDGAYLYCAPPSEDSKTVTVFKTSDMSVAGSVALNGTYTANTTNGAVALGVYKDFLHTFQYRQDGTSLVQHRIYRIGADGVPNAQFLASDHMAPPQTNTSDYRVYLGFNSSRGLSNISMMKSHRKGLLIPCGDGIAISSVLEKESKYIMTYYQSYNSNDEYVTNGKYAIGYKGTDGASNNFNIFEIV